jgi:sugar phosphate isomerase/epimerase
MVVVGMGACLAIPVGIANANDETAQNASGAAASARQDCGGRGRGTISPSKLGINLVSVWNEIFGSYPQPDPPLPSEVINANFWATMEKVSAIGYRGIENLVFPWGVPGVYSDSATEMRRGLKRLKMRTFANWSLIDPTTYASVLRQAHELGADYAGGEPSGFDTLAGALAEAEILNELGKMARKRGLKLQVHNHSPVFTTKFMYDADRDGDEELTAAQEVMMLNTDRRYVAWEIDIHHALTAFGKDNDQLVSFLDKYDKQIEVIHVKGTTATSDEQIDQSDSTAVGSSDDVTDWDRVFSTLDHVKYYLYEWDFPADGIAEARASYEYLRCVRF